MRTQIRRYFATGLLSLLPTIVVGYILWFFWGKLKRATNWIYYTFQIQSTFWSELLFPVIALLLGIGFIIIVGVTSRTLAGRGFVRLWERVIHRIPVLRQVYVAVKQIIAALSKRQKRLFKSVVLIPYPREGMYRVAFVASDEIAGLVPDETLTAVFVPNTPNVTGGFLFFVSRHIIVPLDMTVEDGMKLVMSGGFVVPSSLSGSSSIAARETTTPV
jgi:uncharacterized membrane protein